MGNKNQICFGKGKIYIQQTSLIIPKQQINLVTVLQNLQEAHQKTQQLFKEHTGIYQQEVEVQRQLFPGYQSLQLQNKIQGTIRGFSRRPDPYCQHAAVKTREQIHYTCRGPNIQVPAQNESLAGNEILKVHKFSASDFSLACILWA